MSRIPSPGAVWPAIVMKGLRIARGLRSADGATHPEDDRARPAGLDRRPEGAWSGESFRFVTAMTRPPSPAHCLRSEALGAREREQLAERAAAGPVPGR